MEPYRSYFHNAGLVLPETEKLTQRALQLPTGTALSEMEIEKICKIIRFVIANASEIQERLANLL
jgi:dTDP-4-amino-4,6-dideoxygalactose transaminase